MLLGVELVLFIALMYAILFLIYIAFKDQMRKLAVNIGLKTKLHSKRHRNYSLIAIQIVIKSTPSCEN